MTEILYVMTCEPWMADDKITPLFKIGSTHNLAARRQNAKTWLHKRVKIKGYYLLKNCVAANINCYRLDNHVKMHFNHYRTKEEDAGTEFYRAFDLIELTAFIKSKKLEADWIDVYDNAIVPTKEDLLKDYAEELEHHDTYESFVEEQKKSIKKISLKDLKRVTLMRTNNTAQEQKWMYNHYKNTVVDGVPRDIIAKYHPEIFDAKSSSRIPIWGIKERRADEEGDLIFFIVSDGARNFVDMRTIKHKIVSSKELSNELYNEEDYSEFYILSEGNILNQNKQEFLINIGKKPKWKLAGGPTLNKKKYNPYLISLITYKN
ncbi:MAG: hypothetical protein Hyperionvirus3_84 [Hyperionvirus sp.]|uniref:Bacteriophage T5 Orf172 DNA-binding domain-containing protein n=1 Tax=Hyperionvirus sp. TaxID=2487770 RepID=A0A3G5A6Y6_9VIRU|nr:MAG: hypothetical protein Hyperionvirus3_84 [Hyperionvirus sp.]